MCIARDLSLHHLPDGTELSRIASSYSAYVLSSKTSYAEPGGFQSLAGREQRAESREQRAESREQRAESRDQRAESREQRPKSREQRPKSRERKAEGRGFRPRAEGRRAERQAIFNSALGSWFYRLGNPAVRGTCGVARSRPRRTERGPGRVGRERKAQSRKPTVKGRIEPRRRPRFLSLSAF